MKQSIERKMTRSAAKRYVAMLEEVVDQADGTTWEVLRERIEKMHNELAHCPADKLAEREKRAKVGGGER